MLGVAHNFLTVQCRLE